jgi:DNA-binding response OmpR family regulator
MRLLLVQGNRQLAALTARKLAKAGFEIDVARTMAKCLIRLRTTPFDAIILDRELPDGDGLSVVKTLRKKGNPIPVMIVATMSGVNERVEGLNEGADDYMAMPFSFDELRERMVALLRRPKTYLGRSLRLGNLVFNTLSRELTIMGNHHAITQCEATMLEALLSRSNRIVPKELLGGFVRARGPNRNPNAVEVYVHRLRHELAAIGANVTIQTVHGVGYMIEGPLQSR